MSEELIELECTTPGPIRLDKFLADHLPQLSRNRIQNLIKDGQVEINDIPSIKSSEKVVDSDRIRIHIPDAKPIDLIPEDIPLAIIYEDQDIFVVNKPANMVVHPSAGHQSGTLVHAALAYVPDIQGIGGELRPGIVHRLDKDTSGLIVLAKNDIAHRWMQDQFRKRKVRKEYLTLVDGKPPSPTGRIEANISRDVRSKKKMAVVPSGQGREAVTEYTTLESFVNHTFLSVRLITGRTHQIRLHMAFLKCPVVGDRIYGRKKPSLPISRQFLHAYKISFTKPNSSQMLELEAPLPDSLQLVIFNLQQT